MVVVFFILAVLTAVSTFLAVVAPRRPALLGGLSWAVGLLPCEVPFASLGWNVLLIVVFGLLGAFDSGLGVAGLVLLVLSSLADLELARRSAAAGPAIETALEEGLGDDFAARIGPDLAATLRNRVPMVPVLLKPFMSRRRDVERIADLAYGELGVRNLLDVYRHQSKPSGSPILMYIHGGAWVSGKKNRQGLPLIYYLASQGWLCVAPNYRLSPDATFPDHIIDIKRAIAWVRQHAAEYGGDPDTLFLCGGSAGGHLSSLAALTPNRPELQPGFEQVDTTITAAIPLYGDYDWLDSAGLRAALGLEASRTKFFTEKLLKCSIDDNRALWELGSPLFHVGPQAPPFFVMHGEHDTMLVVEEARNFVATLRKVSTQPVVYAELPGAQHAFDGFQSVRCGHVVNAVERFAAWVRSTAPDDRAVRADRP